MKITKEMLELNTGLKIYRIPIHMIDGLDGYINRGIPQGSFLTAIFENDFVRAIGQADDMNIENIPAYANFLYNYAPRDCWGSKEAVTSWVEKMIRGE